MKRLKTGALVCYKNLNLLKNNEFIKSKKLTENVLTLMFAHPFKIENVDKQNQKFIIKSLGYPYSFEEKWENLEFPSLKFYNSFIETVIYLKNNQKDVYENYNNYLSFSSIVNFVTQEFVKEIDELKKSKEEEILELNNIVETLPNLVNKISVKQINGFEPMSIELEKNMQDINWLQSTLRRYVVWFDKVETISENLETMKNFYKNGLSESVKQELNIETTIEYLYQLTNISFFNCKPFDYFVKKNKNKTKEVQFNKVVEARIDEESPKLEELAAFDAFESYKKNIEKGELSKDAISLLKEKTYSDVLSGSGFYTPNHDSLYKKSK